MSAPPRFAIPLMLMFGGCTLLDQRTFNPDAGRAPVVAAAPVPVVVAPLDPRALFTLRPPAKLDEPALASLLTTIRTARSRKPGVRFAVVAIVPTVDGDSADATAVYRAILAEGTPLGRVELRAEVGSPAETRVFAE